MPRLPVNKDLVARLMPLLVPALTFAVFLPALKNGFVDWDDVYNLVENMKYRGLGPEQLKWMFTTFHLHHYQPLSWATFGMDYLLWGMNPAGYHLTGVILHSVNALLFYLLCYKLLALASPPAAPEEPAELRLAAGFAALVFAVHPLRVESVAWATERRDVLAGLFYLLAILLYIRPRSPGAERTSCLRRSLPPLGAFLLALLSKSMAVTLPAVLLVLDVYPLRRLPGGSGRWFSPDARRVWLEKIPFLLLAAVFSFIAYFWAGKAEGAASYQPPGDAPGAAKAVFAAGFYVWKTLIPLKLAPLYKLPGGFGLLSGAGLATIAALAAITAAAIAALRRWPALPAVWVYYLAALSPAAGLLNGGPQAAADRYTYLPCLGFAALAGAGFLACRRAAKKRVRALCAVLACLIIAGLAALTWRQEGIWRDSETLWRHALTVTPELDYAYNNLGLILEKRGETGLAGEYYGEALRINPQNAQAHSNLADILSGRGELDRAVGHYLEALKINPGYAELHYNLGHCLAVHGKAEEAAVQYREALRLNPGFAEAHNNLAGILAARGKFGEAAEHCLEALKARPGFASAHNNLAGILAARGELDAAAGHYRAALNGDPAFAAAHSGLGGILTAQGRLEEAAEHYRAAARSAPGSASAWYNLGNVLAARGRFGEAAKSYLEALRLAPDFAQAHYNLSVVLSARGEKKQAEEHYRRALEIAPGMAAPK